MTTQSYLQQIRDCVSDLQSPTTSTARKELALAIKKISEKELALIQKEYGATNV